MQEKIHKEYTQVQTTNNKVKRQVMKITTTSLWGQIGTKKWIDVALNL